MLLRSRASALCLGFVVLCAVTASADEPLVVLPNAVTLTGPAARQPLLVQRALGNRLGRQITEDLKFESSDPNVVTTDDEVLIPAGNGEATITVTAGDQSAKVAVRVEHFSEPTKWSFRNQVESVLSKAGCNSGACHGAAAGKNGFYLSLRGYDPEFDYWSITRQARGRRVVPSDPGRSLILMKPTGAVPHKGGLRFDEESIDYRVLSEWIAQGQTPPAADDPRLEKLEILPEQIVVHPGARQQFRVRAFFTDGHVEDVTHWAKFASTNSSVAEIDEKGRAEVKGFGEGSITAWYLGQNVVGTVTSPYEQKVAPSMFAQEPRDNFIDELVLEKLEDLNLPPSPLASDSTFLRRTFLDTIGVLPTEEETRQFLFDTSPDKRTKLIDALLQRPEYVDYWTYRWSDLLLLSGERLRPKGLEAFYAWIREQVKNDVPWDQFARKIVLATGNSYENGAVNFYSLHQDPLDSAETVSMAFLGMSINCARCHDHPLEKWTNNDYYGMANLFARVRAKGWGGDFRSGDGNRDVYVVESGDLLQPRTGRPQPPRPLDGKPTPFDAKEDRRIYLADWLTSPDNPYFARAITNRVWANFMGVGLIEKVDDLRLTNPASNTKLLDALAQFLRDNKYDLKALMRQILRSRTYQRSSALTAGNEADERFYSRYYPRRLKAEVLLDAASQVLAAPTSFESYPEGTRALQLQDASVASYFLSTFGRPERIITCECERSDEPSMVQVLNLMNGDTLNGKLAVEKNIIGQWLEQKLPLEQIVEKAYLRTLSRFPTEAERTQLLTAIAETPTDEQRTAMEDLLWTILSTKEFLFQH